MAKGIDWIKIRTEYETTNISQRKLSEKHDVSYNTLKDKANREKWAKSKEETHIKIASKTHQKAIEKISDDKSDRNIRHLNVWDKILNKIDDLASKDKWTIYTINGIVEIDVEPKDLTNLAAAMDKVQKGQRLAEGLDKNLHNDNLQENNDKIMRLADLLNKPVKDRLISDFEEEE